jgi:hypothetical protein
LTLVERAKEERKRERERSKGEAEMVPGGFSVENLGRGIKQVRTAEYGGLKQSTSLEPNRSINKVKLVLVRDEMTKRRVVKTHVTTIAD